MGWPSVLQGRLRRAAVACALTLCTAPAWALIDVWGWTDSYGTAHFAQEQVDARYKLLFRARTSFDSDEAADPVADVADLPSPALARLRDWIGFSPGAKAVSRQLRSAAQSSGLDFELLQALIAAESGFDPAAVSPRGAIGLMQLLPSTAQQYGVTDAAQHPITLKLTDPSINIRAGTRHLRYLVDLFAGQLELALAAYNAGQGAVQRAGNRVPDYPETQNYVKTVMQLYRALKPVALGAAAPNAAPRRVRMELPAVPDSTSTVPAEIPNR